MNSDETFTFKARRRWLLFVIVAIVSTCGRFASSAPLSPCPEFCECFLNKNGLQSAACADLPSNTTTFPNIHELTLRPPDVGAECHIPEDVATVFPQLNFLQLKNCSLTYIPSGSFRELKSLEEVDLSNNFLRKFSQSLFSANSKLRYVNLHNNPLNISARPLLSSNSIMELDLSACNISKLPQNLFKSLTSLKYLTLSNNTIKSIKENTLPSGLKMLILANNNVTNVPIGELNRLTRLRELDLSHNPVNCTCELMNFQSWVSGKGMIFLNPIECVYPKEYAGRKLLSLPQYEMCDAKIEREPTTTEQCTGQLCFNRILEDEGYVMDQPSSDKPSDGGDIGEFLPTNNNSVANSMHAPIEGSGNDEILVDRIEGSGDTDAVTDFIDDHSAGQSNDTESTPVVIISVVSDATPAISEDTPAIPSTTPVNPDDMGSQTEFNPIELDIKQISLTNSSQDVNQMGDEHNMTAGLNGTPFTNPSKHVLPGQFSARYMIPSLLILAVILICFSVYFSQHNCRTKGWNEDDPKANNTTELHDVNLLSPDSLTQNGNKYSSKYPGEGESGQTEKLMNGTDCADETVDSCRLLNGQSAANKDVPEPIQTVKAKVTTNPDSIPKTPTIVRKD